MNISPIAQNAGYLSSVTGIFIICVGFLVLKIYMERKKKATFYLFLSMIAWGIASFSASVIYFQAGINLELGVFAQKLTYALVFLGIMMTLLFATEVFIKIQKKWLNLYISVGFLIIIVMFFVDSVIIGEFPDETSWPLLNIDLPFILLTVVYLIPTILTILFIAFKTSRRVQEREHKIGLRIIGLGQMMIILTFISDVLQGIMIDDLNLYAMFLYFTWIFPLIAIFCYYLGWIMPKWFVSLFQVKTGAKKND
jgi:hypothetical protein